MAIELDAPRAPQIPVADTREVGQVVVGMICDKWVRERFDKDGDPIKNKRGATAKEEVLVILTMPGTTGTIKVGSGLDVEERAPEAGELSRVIVSGVTYKALIDARREAGGQTQVGDVIRIEAKSATIWRGRGDMLASGVTDPEKIAKAIAQKLSVGMDREVRYRRAKPDEAALVAKAEQVFHERKAARAITLDGGTPTASTPTTDDFDDEF